MLPVIPQGIKSPYKVHYNSKNSNFSKAPMYVNNSVQKNGDEGEWVKTISWIGLAAVSYLVAGFAYSMLQRSLEDDIANKVVARQDALARYREQQKKLNVEA